MKQNFLRGLAFVLVLMMLFVTSVGTVSAKGLKTITFKGVSFIASKGYVFRFSVTGDVKAKDLPGFIRIGKRGYDLNCRVGDSADLVCSTSDSLKGYVGRSLHGAVGGFAFTAVVPKPIVPLKTRYCYGIFDYGPDAIWSQIGVYCKINDPTIDPTIDFYNPAWEDSSTYYYYEDGSATSCNLGAPNWGPGYYFDDPEFC